MGSHAVIVREQHQVLKTEFNFCDFQESSSLLLIVQ